MIVQFCDGFFKHCSVSIQFFKEYMILKRMKQYRNIENALETVEDELFCPIFEDTYILSTAIAYLCVIDAKHFLNDPHSDKNAIMSSVFIP